MRALASALMLCHLGLVVSPGTLQVNVVFEGAPIPARLKAAAIKEVALVWAPYGVDVHAASADDADSGLRIAVVVHARTRRPAPIEVLASTQFLADVPEPVILVYPDAVDAVVTATLTGRSDPELSSVFRDLATGRVFGRALAHEIGHVLLRSAAHSNNGLMRATHSAFDLISPSRQQFTLSCDDVTRLMSLVPGQRTGALTRVARQ